MARGEFAINDKRFLFIDKLRPHGLALARVTCMPDSEYPLVYN